jgi:hypothetical protein
MANPTQGDDQDDFSGVRNKDGTVKRAGLARTAKLSPFGLAFDTARKEGKKEFTFRGKRYTTEMAKPKAKAPPADKAPSKSSADYKQDAEDFKKIAYDSRAKTEGVRDLANRMLGKEKYEAGAMPSLPELETDPGSLSGPFKKGGKVKSKTKKYASGGSVKASKRGDGCAQRGKTKGRMV